MNRRLRQQLTIASVLAFAAIAVWAGLTRPRNPRVTADLAARYVDETDLVQLSGADRAAALRALAQMVNGLTLEERRKWWLEGHWRNWFQKMTETEKTRYLDATLPTGLKQVLKAFEQLPDATRKKAIDDAMRTLKETHQVAMDREPGHAASVYGTNPPPVLSAELQNRVRMIGFKTFYVESSAETKAELAPFVEELQHQLENERFIGQ